MCGIAGFVNRDGEPADRGILARMTATLAHRGPDGSGLRVDGPVGLGHRRLSIIDVGGGSQPMGNEDGSIWVTFNGEIYNDPELRAWLLARGHTFRTDCDTEGLVHLYEEHGPDFAGHLNGMFALAIWDGPRKRLVLARDRMGQKPLYYAETAGGGLVFGSEPKALLAHPDVARRLDPRGLARYLFYEYVPGPHSIWEGLKKLPPAHTLAWESGRSTVTRYWESPGPSADPPPFEEAATQFWDDFRAAVGRHRRSDVPLGVFLSGGVDSSSVAAALAELEPARNIRTFSIGFDDPSFDESGHARAVARHLGTDHRERTFSAGSVMELLPEVAGWLDEPFGDASVLPTHLLSRFAREEVTVRVAREAGASCTAAVLEGGEAVMIARALPLQLVPAGAGIGYRLPAYCSALGRVLLAALPPDGLAGYLQSATLEAVTAQTVTDRGALEAAIGAVREAGFAYVDQEAEAGFRSVAVPLKRFDGTVVAAINIGARVEQADRAVMTGRLLALLLAEAAELSGYLA